MRAQSSMLGLFKIGVGLVDDLKGTGLIEEEGG